MGLSNVMSHSGIHGNQSGGGRFPACSQVPLISFGHNEYSLGLKKYKFENGGDKGWERCMPMRYRMLC